MEQTLDELNLFLERKQVQSDIKEVVEEVRSLKGKKKEELEAFMETMLGRKEALLANEKIMSAIVKSSMFIYSEQQDPKFDLNAMIEMLMAVLVSFDYDNIIKINADYKNHISK